MHTGAGTEAAAEAIRLLDRMTQLAASAADELERGDADRLAPLLDEREALIARADPLLRRIPTAASTDAVLSAALRLQAADSRLTLALASGLHETARELDQMETEEVVRSAYGQRRAERGSIDIVR